jgi:hypothetical protein
LDLGGQWDGWFYNYFDKSRKINVKSVIDFQPDLLNLAINTVRLFNFM